MAPKGVAGSLCWLRFAWGGLACLPNLVETLESNPISLNYPLLSPSAWQAILFYVPRWLWKNWEAGKIAALMMDLDLGIISEVEKRQKKKLLLEYLYTNLKNHNFWAYRYFFCELLALLNVIGERDVKVNPGFDVGELGTHEISCTAQVNVFV